MNNTVRVSFPKPWSVTEDDRRFVLRDRDGRAITYVYFKDIYDHGSHTLFTRDEARHIAASVVKLSVLWSKK